MRPATTISWQNMHFYTAMNDRIANKKIDTTDRNLILCNTRARDKCSMQTNCSLNNTIVEQPYIEINTSNHQLILCNKEIALIKYFKKIYLAASCAKFSNPASGNICKLQ